MHSSNPALIEFIRAEIELRGPVTFAWFMEQALYHPGHGYYSSGRAAIGREGDFFTNVSVGPLFGQLLARRFTEMWERLGKPTPFTIVEQGANSGQFAQDVLSALSGTPLAEVLEYRVVEPFERLRQKQELLLGTNPAVHWHESLKELQPFRGVHFSNELVDAMRVHLLHRTGNCWQERHVTNGKSGFEFVDLPVSHPSLVAPWLPETENYQAEVNLEGPRWIQEVAAKIDSGYLLAIDYGYERSEFYAPDRITGTLSCYSRHRRSYEPLRDVGEIDITAHVEFTSLIEAGQHAGLQMEALRDQHHFMVELGSSFFSDSQHGPTKEEQKRLRAFQTLMHPGLMGLRFHALSMSKALPPGL